MIVEIKNATKSFAHQIALQKLTVSLPKGKITGIVGPDGAGKTTLIRLMAALLWPTNGTIQINGYDTVKESESIHQMIGYMPQRFGLYEDLTVMQNLSLYADLNGVIGEERKKTFERLLHFTNLAPFTQRLAQNLSGGMKQKLGLACTLIRKPVLLLLDEPSVGVDPISRRELWKMIHELTQDEISIVVSSTYLDEAEKCHSVLLLDKGNVLFNGPPDALTAQAKGRTFKVHPAQKSRRIALFELVNRSEVVDGTIQGADLRIVTREAKPPEGVSSISVPPRFEDAFIDILGGSPKGLSRLAQSAPEVKTSAKFVVEAEHLIKKFGNFTAVNEISFQVQKGEIFGLLGPNGAGKSTIFKMLCGLLKISSGKATVYGKSLLDAPAKARAYIGYMAQKFSLYGGLTVLQNLEFFSGAYNLIGLEQKRAIEQMCEIFNFKPYLHSISKDLPLGYKQRLALACAVMHHPPVLFLDEPTSGVDPITRREFWNHINGLVEKGTTIIVTTHFMDEAEYCDRIGLIFNGKIVTIGTPDSLKEKAKTEKTPNPTLEDAFIHLIQPGNHAES